MKVDNLKSMTTWNEAAHRVKEQMLELNVEPILDGPLGVAGLQDAMISDFEKLVELIFHSKDKQDEKTYENIL